jgi:lipopolysaccharide assembly protein A
MTKEARMSTPSEEHNAFARFVQERWLSLVLIVIAVLFIVQNRQSVSIVLFWADLSAPLWLVMALIFLVGLVAGGARTKRRQRAKR